MMTFKFENKKGITLVETILYLALFAIIFVLVVQFVLRIDEDQSKNIYRIESERNIIIFDRHFNSVFTLGDSIDLTNSSFGSDTGRIRLIDGAQYLEYTLRDGVLYFSRNGTENRLSLPNLVVESFYLTRINDSEGNPTGAEIKIRMNSWKGNFSKETESVYLIDN